MTESDSVLSRGWIITAASVVWDVWRNSLQTVICGSSDAVLKLQ